MWLLWQGLLRLQNIQKDEHDYENTMLRWLCLVLFGISNFTPVSDTRYFPTYFASCHIGTLSQGTPLQ